MSSCVSFQVERVVEAFSTEGTKIAFHVAVAFHVSVQESLQAESLLADFALELAVLLGPHRLRFLRLGTGRKIERQGVLDPVSTVDQLQRGVGWNSEPLLDDGDPHLQAGDAADVILLIRRGRRALLPRRLHLATAGAW